MAATTQSGFVRSVGVLVGGTAFAQALLVVASPALTRLYSPREFSVLAVYASILGITSVIAGLRFDVAIPMPEEDGVAANLLGLAVISTVSLASVAALLTIAFPKQLTHLLGQPGLRPYLVFVPLGILLSGLYNALQAWSTRKKAFPIIARTRIVQSVAGTSAQVGLGLANIKPLGLIVGQILNSGAGIFGLARRAIKYDREALRRVSKSGMGAAFKAYERFPKYSTLDALANSAGALLPVVMIGSLAPPGEAGFVLLAMRTMQAPMALVGGAIAQVYLSRAPQEYRVGRLGDFTSKTLGGLLKTGVGPLVFAGIAAPPLFALVFGREWRRAGELVTWMTPWFVLQFVASPISMVMHVTNRQRSMLALSVSGFAFRIVPVLIVSKLAAGCTPEAYAIGCAVFYMACNVVFLHAARASRSSIVRNVRGGLLILTLWILAGTLVRLASALFFST